MAAVEMFPHESVFTESWRPSLRVVGAGETIPQWPRGQLVTHRIATRARMKVRRRRMVLLAVVFASLLLLAVPDRSFGGTNGVGLSTDLATSSTLSSGMVYVVQAGDTVSSIARLLNPVKPSLAVQALVAELRSNVVVAGEHVVIP